MKKILFLATLTLALLAGAGAARGQALKVNAPFFLAGTPNIGLEWKLSQQITVNGDVLWMPYMFKKTEEVFRLLQTSIDFRWYVKPRYYYTNGLFDGFYLGPYAIYDRFNIGLATHKNPLDDRRQVGWAISGGVSLGYKFYLSRRFRLDVNLGVGYAHLQYNTHILGGEYARRPISKKDTKWWVGPTKFGVHLVYNLFK